MVPVMSREIDCTSPTGRVYRRAPHLAAVFGHDQFGGDVQVVAVPDHSTEQQGVDVHLRSHLRGVDFLTLERIGRNARRSPAGRARRPAY